MGEGRITSLPSTRVSIRWPGRRWLWLVSVMIVEATWSVMPSRDDLAKDMGIWQASIATPQILSGAVGALVDWGNAYRTGYGYTFTFLFAGLAFALGTALVSRVRGSR